MALGTPVWKDYSRGSVDFELHGEARRHTFSYAVLGYILRPCKFIAS